ncbi:MAG: tetratricopeptide repeat protein [Acetobacteraceae bacterium]
MRRMVMFAVALTLAAPAWAADMPQTPSSSDMAAIRAQIKAKDYAGALAALNRLVNAGIVDADVYNLLGFASRKTGALDRAAGYYRQALDMEPNHRGALEYQGELFLQRGDRAGAERNLPRLKVLCPSGCEEREDLEAAIKVAGG